MASNTIILRGDSFHDEATANGASYPGMLMEIDSDGKAQAHSTEGGRAERLLAVENALNGETVDDDYADGDTVMLERVVPGSKVQVLLKAGENVGIGDELISAGDGKLIADGSESSGVTVAQRLFRAAEALDLSDSGDSDTLCSAWVL